MSLLKFIWGVVFVFFFLTVNAGDDPCGATPLDTDAIGEITFDNSGNTDSGIEAPLMEIIPHLICGLLLRWIPVVNYQCI